MVDHEGGLHEHGFDELTEELVDQLAPASSVEVRNGLSSSALARRSASDIAWTSVPSASESEATNPMRLKGGSNVISSSP